MKPRPLHARSAGFTLMELMVAAPLFLLIAAAVFMTCLGATRMLRRSYAEAELSIRTRELRDKLLFQSAPMDGQRTVWGGLLSSTNAYRLGQANAGGIVLPGMRLPARGGGVAGASQQAFRLGFSNPGTPNCGITCTGGVDEDWSTRWLDPGRLSFFAGRPSPNDIVVHAAESQNQGRLFYIQVTARKGIGGSAVAEHNERIVVPVFGQIQTTRTDGRGGL